MPEWFGSWCGFSFYFLKLGVGKIHKIKTKVVFKVQLCTFYKVHHMYFPKWKVYNKGPEKSTLEITIAAIILFFLYSMCPVLSVSLMLNQCWNSCHNGIVYYFTYPFKSMCLHITGFTMHQMMWNYRPIMGTRKNQRPFAIWDQIVG